MRRNSKKSAKTIRPLLHRTFFWHFSRNLAIGIVIIITSLFLGMLGYHHFEKMSWTDAYVNASMILSGMGPMGTLSSDASKIFAGTYALFSGMIFLVVVGLVFAPIVHWFFIRFHIEEANKK